MNTGANVMNHPHPRRYPGVVLPTRFSPQGPNLGWEVDTTTISILGIESARSTFQLHGADISAKALIANPLATLSKDFSQPESKVAPLDAY